MFSLDKQTLRYGAAEVLQDVTLRIEAGERVSLLGKSGSGKSTLLKTLHAQAPDKVALIPQDTALVQTLSVFHNVYMGQLHQRSTWYNLRNLVWPTKAEIDRMVPLLDTLGLSGKRRSAVGELSGGQKQRTAVGRAVHQQRDILFGDEPVSAVDDHQARDVLELISGRHNTVVLAMHDVALALEYSDRIIGLADGKVVLDQPSANLTPADLRFLYQQEVTPSSRQQSDQQDSGQREQGQQDHGQRDNNQQDSVDDSSPCNTAKIASLHNS